MNHTQEFDEPQVEMFVVVDKYETPVQKFHALTTSEMSSTVD